MADFEIGQRIYIKWCFQLIERLADLERQLAEAKNMAKWTPITPHNLPKVGWEVGRTSANDPLGPYNVRGVREVSQMLVDTCRDMDTWIFYGYRVTRSINPPQPAEAEWSRQCNECGADEYTSSISEEDISKEMYSCGNCGSTEFHKVMPL